MIVTIFAYEDHTALEAQTLADPDTGQPYGTEWVVPTKGIPPAVAAALEAVFADEQGCPGCHGPNIGWALVEDEDIHGRPRAGMVWYPTYVVESGAHAGALCEDCMGPVLEAIAP